MSLRLGIESAFRASGLEIGHFGSFEFRVKLFGG